MPRFKQLKIKKKENHRKSPQIPGIPQSFQRYFLKENAQYLQVVRCQKDFRMGFALCEYDGCKTAEMRVGAHLEPILEILMGTYPQSLIFWI